jgi:hypothetical protein
MTRTRIQAEWRFLPGALAATPISRIIHETRLICQVPLGCVDVDLLRGRALPLARGCPKHLRSAGLRSLV